MFPDGEMTYLNLLATNRGTPPAQPSPLREGRGSAFCSGYARPGSWSHFMRNRETRLAGEMTDFVLTHVLTPNLASDPSPNHAVAAH